MKKYIIPAIIVANINNETILAGSGEGGVDTGGTPGNEFNNGDVSYTNRRGLFDWTDDNEE